MSLRKGQLPAFDAGERFERRTGCAAAIAAMAIDRIEKLIRNRIRNDATEASSSKYPSIHRQALNRCCGI
jgi:hypothetical protein